MPAYPSAAVTWDAQASNLCTMPSHAAGANVFTRADAVHRRLGAGAACGHCQRHGDDGDAQGRPAELSGAGAAGSSLP